MYAGGATGRAAKGIAGGFIVQRTPPKAKADLCARVQGWSRKSAVRALSLFRAVILQGSKSDRAASTARRLAGWSIRAQAFRGGAVSGAG